MAADIKKEEQFTSPEEEVSAIERKVEEARRELAGRGEKVPEERELLREVLRRHIEELRPKPVAPPVSAKPPPPPARPLTDDLKRQAEELKKKEKEEAKVQRLVEIALTRTVNDAVRVAEEATPYLLDELHDHLVDDYYDKLVALRKIKAL